MALTDGEAALCYQCGSCTAVCPWGEVRNEALPVRRLVRQAQVGLRGDDASLWLCTTCTACSALCPRGVDILRVMRALRSMAWERREVEKGLPSLLWSIHWNNNPWSQPPTQRSIWSKGLELPIFNPQAHEILLYVGCTSSYDRRAQKIARALARLLHAAGVRFGILGNEEPCCGEAALSVGHLAYFQEVLAKAQHVFMENGVSTLLTVSPHCYDVFKNHLPASVDQEGISSYHYTQYLATLLDEGRLQFGPMPGVAGNEQHDKIIVTYQDPCYLGRHNSEYNASRAIIKAIPGLELVEMAQWGEAGLCCGGGGGRMWLETPPGERFADIRVRQAVDAEASILATACPFCAVCLEDSLKAARLSGLRVLDVAEIASAALLV
jgi:Fe-S oxidoreductase